MPVGTVGTDKPIIILPNYRLQISGEINVGDISSIKLHAEKPVYDEASVYTLLTAALGT
jgi:hypothetical protein